MKTILLTGATDGIGFETAKLLVAMGHTLLIHGRSEQKLADTQQQLRTISGSGAVQAYRADLSKIADVRRLAADIAEDHSSIDVIINNAGVFRTATPTTENGHDLRFIVNTVSPYLLTQLLLSLVPTDGRVINLSSAAQASVSLQALAGEEPLGDNQAYAQSKLAITMWTFHLAKAIGAKGPAIIAVNPASLLASKMVKDAYGVAGNDLGIGADILMRAALNEEFEDASGKYFDNDRGQFSNPHPDALSDEKNKSVVLAIEEIIADLDVNET
ncbi:SDR family NAD(P)-dependent oxidoreductase [Congregibacter brevis]|uniref:SDR family NAD(P)-dependent oxidoreductase n=1 Tax=Congregibacter brevis TaxID=3081201 RepID=A0ABZ0IHE2_9GAMM|nr:SDR family NAD(P)-dependent oxidoreductase [Congregibacter sp. IMCC45268]